MDLQIEDKILLSTCSWAASPSRISEMISDQELNWSNLLRSADAHRVIPLLYKALTKLPSDQLPAELMVALKKKYLLNLKRNILLSSELFNILEELSSRGIRAIAFKGPIMASFAYGDISFRQFDDLDILVSPKDVFGVEEMLVSRGYTRDEPEFSKVQNEALLRFQHHYSYRNNRLGFHIESHWRLSPVAFSMSLDLPAIWKRALSVMIDGREVLSLSSEDMFIVACDHGARHYWRRLAWICDVARLATMDCFNFEDALERAEVAGSKRSVLLGLNLAKTLLNISLPPEILKMLSEDPAVERLTVEAVQRLFKKAVADDIKIQSDPDEGVFYLRTREHLLDRMWYYIGRSTLPTAEDIHSVPLPDLLFPLYYLVRPVRLVKKYGVSIFDWVQK